MNGKRALIAGGLFVVVAFGAFFVFRGGQGTTDKDNPLRLSSQPGQSGACGDAVTTIMQEMDCDKKFAAYSRSVKACRDQYVMVENPEPYETVFADEIFEVFRCFQQKEDLTKAKSALEFALTQTDWQMNGPAGCSGHGMARAEIEAITRLTPGCLKSEAIEGEIRKLATPFNPAALERMLGARTVLSLGTYESDDVCPVTFSEATEALKTNANLPLKILSTEPSEEGTRVKLARPSAKEPWLVLDFVPVNGCMHLNQLLTNTLEP